MSVLNLVKVCRLPFVYFILDTNLGTQRSKVIHSSCMHVIGLSTGGDSDVVNKTFLGFLGTRDSISPNLETGIEAWILYLAVYWQWQCQHSNKFSSVVNCRSLPQPFFEEKRQTHGTR